ncbi:alpha/beta fold family hydrolase [Oleiphilus messinensis]|uniref:Alpha/beta fold family hydrolase n=1 Tax=Oleiphilus messinensis TaxID=141451 RepID=A0A1Y0IE05_9GAMM|nr:alpha/beta fold hydrolase [Oleiphilus messinensis]ARU58399.1 alpha/beta fold family hydrolase [Oleiphilus messinensis]
MRQEKVAFDSLGDQLQGLLFTPSERQNCAFSAVIVAHGAIDRKENFFEFAQYLCESGFVVLALDMHGHGESAGRRYHVRMSEWVPDIDAAITFLTNRPEVDAAKIGLFGFSSGGTAVLKAAAMDLQQKVGAVVTLDATVRPVVNQLETLAFNLLSWVGSKTQRWLGKDLRIPLYRVAISQPVAVDPEVNGFFFSSSYLKEGYSAYPLPGALESIVVNILEDVKSIRAPVCVIHGEEDKIDKPQSGKMLFANLNCEKSLHLLPNSGHVGHMDYNKQEVFALTRDWFRAKLV